MILIPDLPEIENHSQSDAERRVARTLHNIPSSLGTAFHSVHLRSHRYKQVAEADFVILWKGMVVVIEVKGGGVQRFEGVWYSIDRRGDAHKLSTSPMEQARSAMFALRDIFREDGVSSWFPMEAVVITPDIEAPPASPEWKKSHWVGKERMTEGGVRQVLDELAAGARRRESALTTSKLREKLFGEFTRLPAVDAQRGAILDEQNRATNGQIRVLAGLASVPRICVLGGAGTGKSVVLAEAAKQEAEAGRSVLVTYRSQRLREFFAPRFKGRNIDQFAYADLPNLRKYEVVLVDEAQDLMSAEAMDRIDRLVDGGRENGRWRIFLDPNNQAQIDGEFDQDVFHVVLADSIVYNLSLNVRNTKAIVHAVQEYLGADIGDPGIVHGDRIQWRWTLDDDNTVTYALQIARDMKNAGIAASEIWVIAVAKDPDRDEIIDGIRVLSPRSAKGLEAEHVVVCDLPEMYDGNSMAAFYVALTRARVTLHIVGTKSDKTRLQQIARAKGR